MSDTADGPRTPTLSEVRRDGVAVRVVVLNFRRHGVRTASGALVHEIILSVIRDAQPTRLTTVVSAVPRRARPLLVPGIDLPARLLESDHRALWIDWSGALSERGWS